MTFVSGGATQAHFDGFELFDLRTGALQAVHINPQNYDGWFIGSGYEYALPFVPGLFWKTEYRYSQFKTVGLNWLQDGSNIFLNEVSRVRLYEHTVRTELVWRFNWSGPVRAAY